MFRLTLTFSACLFLSACGLNMPIGLAGVDSNLPANKKVTDALVVQPDSTPGKPEMSSFSDLHVCFGATDPNPSESRSAYISEAQSRNLDCQVTRKAPGKSAKSRENNPNYDFGGLEQIAIDTLESQRKKDEQFLGEILLRSADGPKLYSASAGDPFIKAINYTLDKELTGLYLAHEIANGNKDYEFLEEVGYSNISSREKFNSWKLFVDDINRFKSETNFEFDFSGRVSFGMERSDVTMENVVLMRLTPNEGMEPRLAFMCGLQEDIYSQSTSSDRRAVEALKRNFYCLLPYATNKRGNVKDLHLAWIIVAPELAPVELGRITNIWPGDVVIIEGDVSSFNRYSRSTDAYPEVIILRNASYKVISPAYYDGSPYFKIK